jgi:phage baseplate assembly protein gpV
MPFYGKYRGKVIDNDDPLKLGRLKTMVPALSDQELTWALPCTPYAGLKVGWYVMPPVGANVWIEFEAGDTDYPIWVGGFWSKQDEMPPDATGPAVKVLQTDKMVLILDDENVKLTVRVPTDDATYKIEMDKNGIVLTAGQVTATVAKDKIVLENTPCTVEVADDIMLKKTGASITIADSITTKNGAASIEVATANIDLKNGASSIALSPATVSVNNGALEVM